MSLLHCCTPAVGTNEVERGVQIAAESKRKTYLYIVDSKQKKTTQSRFAKIPILKYERVLEKFYNEWRVYESVDDRGL